MKKFISIFLILTIMISMLSLVSCDFWIFKTTTITEATTTTIPDVPSVRFDGGYDSSEVMIEIWHLLHESSGITAIEKAALRFKEIYPNITIKTMTYGDYNQIYEFVNKTDKENRPNLIFCSPELILEYNKSNSIVTLDSFVDSDYVIESTGEMMGFTEEQIDDLVDNFYNEGRILDDGKMYYLPLYRLTDLLYYNKSVFDELGLEAPQTWKDVENCIQVIKENYPDSIPLGCESTENLFITLAAQYGSDYTSNTGNNYLFVNDTNKSFVSKFAEWYQKGWFTTDYPERGPYDDFASGKILMSIASSAGVRYHSPNKVDGEYTFELGVAPMPQVDTSSPKSISYGPSIAMLESENIQGVYASWLFLKFLMTDPETQGLLAVKYLSMPMTNSALESNIYTNMMKSYENSGSLLLTANEFIVTQSTACFIPAVFTGADKTKENVGLLMKSVFSKYQLGANNSTMIDEEFIKALANCK